MTSTLPSKTIYSSTFADSEETPIASYSMDDFIFAQIEDKCSVNGAEHERRSTISHAQSTLRPRLDIKETIKLSFDGVVISVNRDQTEFEARIVNRKNAFEEEFATFDFEEVPKPDLELVKVGSEFSWYLGFLEGKKTPRINFSKIRFRRLPKWTKEDIDELQGTFTRAFSYVQKANMAGSTE